MSRMKNWMMEMEETVDDAVISDCSCVEDVVQYCNENLTYVDEDYVREYYEREGCLFAQSWAEKASISF